MSTTAPRANSWARNTDTRPKTRLPRWTLVGITKIKLEKRRYGLRTNLRGIKMEF